MLAHVRRHRGAPGGTMSARSVLAVASSLAIPALASAHPGHGLDPSGASLLHALEPEHALPLFAAACLGAVLLGVAALARRSG
jgi:hypothetical protein